VKRRERKHRVEFQKSGSAVSEYPDQVSLILRISRCPEYRDLLPP
jgi:hypothetical protein